MEKFYHNKLLFWKSSYPLGYISHPFSASKTKTTTMEWKLATDEYYIWYWCSVLLLYSIQFSSLSYRTENWKINWQQLEIVFINCDKPEKNHFIPTIALNLLLLSFVPHWRKNRSFSYLHFRITFLFLRILLYM